MQPPIIKKILIFGVVSAAIALMLACIGFGIVEFYKVKNETIVKVKSQMDILAYNLQPTLVFEDAEAAYKILRVLEEDKSINRVLLYKSDGHLFTAYMRSDTNGDIKITKTIFYNFKPIGRLEIEAIYLGVQDKIIAYLL